MTLKEAKLRAIAKHLDLEKQWYYYSNLLMYTSDQTNYTYEKKRYNDLSNDIETLSSYYYMTFNKRLIDDLEHYKRIGVLK